MADLLILDDADQPIVTPIAFTSLGPGVTSAPVTLHVWWAQGEPAEPPQAEGALVALARLAGSSAAFEDGSTRMQLTGGIEMREAGGTWIAARNGGGLRLPVIPADNFIPVELRVTAPIGAGAALDVELLIEPHVLRPLAWSPDLLPGVVLSGLGDRRRSGIYTLDGDVVEQGVPGDTVDTPAVSWIGLGAPYFLAAGTFTPSATDGNGDPLAAGEGYVSALTLGAGAYVEVKGIKAAVPLDELDRPAVPPGTPVLAWIERDDTAVIEDADITQGPGAGFYHATSAGLTVTINPDGHGSAVGGRHARYRTPQPITMTALTTQLIYLLPDSSLERVDVGVAPTDPLAVAIWRATTDAGSVTLLEDLRPWSPAPVVFRFELGAMVTGAVTYATVERDLDVLPLFGQARLSLVDNPGSADSTDLDIEVSAAGAGAWSTIASLSIAFDATVATATARPEITALAAGDVLRAIVTAQTATAQPAAGAVVLVGR